jgi:hypothetical protein
VARYAWYDSHDEGNFLGFGAHLYELESVFSRATIDDQIKGFGVDVGIGLFNPSGGRFLHEGGYLLPDYARLAAEARPTVRNLLSDVVALAAEQGANDARSIVGVVAGLMQDGIIYKIPPVYREGHPGDTRLTAGLLVPLETLTIQPSDSRAGWGWGDCDTKSLLFASLVTQLTDLDVILMMGRQHMFAGVSLPPHAGEDAVAFQGTPYVLIELTAPGWRLGHLPPDSRQHLREFRAIYVANAARSAP